MHQNFQIVTDLEAFNDGAHGLTRQRLRYSFDRTDVKACSREIAGQVMLNFGSNAGMQ